MVNVCQCCGHPLPDNDVLLELTLMQRRIYLELQRAGKRGLTRSELVDRLYVGDANGGPLTAKNGLSVQRGRMEGILRTHQLKITSTRGADALWRLTVITGGDHDGTGAVHSRGGVAARVADASDGR